MEGNSLRRICRFFVRALPVWLGIAIGAALSWNQLQANERPNVVVILADDLGYSDLGCYGGEIATPNLDRLAEGGLQFTQFYNTGRCWPTRASLLTGYYAQQVRRDFVPGVTSGGRGVRPVWAPLLPELLRQAGYRSYHSGKWHIDGNPLQQGFDRSYLLQDSGRYFSPTSHFENGKPLPAVERRSGYYSTVALVDRAVAFLEDHLRNHADRPFFLYLTFLAPHFPLHAMPEDIGRYAGRYRRGWETVRSERRARQVELGIAPGKSPEIEREVGPPYDFPEAMMVLGEGEVNRPLPWDTLSDSQRSFQAAKMELHAAMIDRMDRETGKLLEFLRMQGKLENTLILFLSDNGASAEIMVRDDGHDPSAAPGSAATHLCLGPGWSSVANTPFRRHKTWVHEGGICTPLIVHWPLGIPATGELRECAGHVIDIVPTILEIAGVERPEEWEGKPVPAIPGRSLTPAFRKDSGERHEALWWEHEGNRALREGDWKIVAARDRPWELYHLRNDRAETENLAESRPEMVREMANRWERMREQFYSMARDDEGGVAEPVER